MSAPSPAAAGRPRVTGVVLAGGRATRYGGRPKGLERVGGVRIVDRVAAALGAACDALLLVASAPGADAWLPGVPVAGDVRPGCGSLGGLHAALAHAGGPVVVAAWDMPFVPAALAAALRALGEGGARAALPRHPGGAVEPLCAYYGPGCLAAAEGLLAAGERRARALAEAVGAAHLAGPALARCGDPAVMFLNVNAPADLARARALAGAPPA